MEVAKLVGLSGHGTNFHGQLELESHLKLGPPSREYHFLKTLLSPLSTAGVFKWRSSHQLVGPPSRVQPSLKKFRETT